MSLSLASTYAIYPYLLLLTAKGQRYDVIINANQTAANYWFRVSIGCGTNKILNANVTIGAILHYTGIPEGNPTSTGVTMRTTCTDETNLVPYVPNQVPRSLVPEARQLQLSSFVNASQNNLFRWLLNGSTQVVNWEKPSLQTALEGSSDFGNNSNLYEIQKVDGWYLWWIQNTGAVRLPHPIHLHGHDFYLLGKGSGVWDQTTNGLNFDNPTRRDTTTMPAGGFLLLAFPADNPGVWVRSPSFFFFSLLCSVPLEIIC